MTKYYRVKDIEKLIDRDKTTLFRWEKEDKIDPPIRDSRGWRLYTEEDLEKMKKLINFHIKFNRP
jgi:DNA-binding transcriptional MerR regulator